MGRISWETLWVGWVTVWFSCERFNCVTVWVGLIRVNMVTYWVGWVSIMVWISRVMVGLVRVRISVGFRLNAHSGF